MLEETNSDHRIGNLMAAAKSEWNAAVIAKRRFHRQRGPALGRVRIDSCATFGVDELSARRRAHRLQYLTRLGLERPDDNRNAGADDTGLFRGDGLERRAEVLLVVEIDGCDGSGNRLDDVGGIEPAAEPDFQYRELHSRISK